MLRFVYGALDRVSEKRVRLADGRLEMVLFGYDGVSDRARDGYAQIGRSTSSMSGDEWVRRCRDVRGREVRMEQWARWNDGVSADGREPSRVLTVPTGAPIVLRGTCWIGGAPVGLLHRSPPIAGTGETRLVLVVDPINDPEDER